MDCFEAVNKCTKIKLLGGKEHEKDFYSTFSLSGTDF